MRDANYRSSEIGMGDLKEKIAPTSGCQGKRKMGSNFSSNGDFVYTDLMG